MLQIVSERVGGKGCQTCKFAAYKSIIVSCSVNIVSYESTDILDKILVISLLNQMIFDMPYWPTILISCTSVLMNINNVQLHIIVHILCHNAAMTAFINDTHFIFKFCKCNTLGQCKRQIWNLWIMNFVMNLGSVLLLTGLSAADQKSPTNLFNLLTRVNEVQEHL